MPGHGQAAERVTHDEVARVVRLVADAQPRVADPHPQRWRRAQPELVAGEVAHGGVDLEDGAAGAGPRRRQVAGKREPAATDVERLERLALGERGVHGIGERAGVVEFEDGGIGEVDVAVAQVVEPQDATGGAERVVVDADAVVGALDLTRLGGHRPEGESADRHRHDDRDHGGVAPARARA